MNNMLKDILLKEYEHVSNDLSRYDSESQKIIFFLSILISTAFVLGFKESIESIFLIIPLLSFILIQFLLSNNYAYRMRESYLMLIERIMRTELKHFPRFYHKEVPKYYFNLKRWEMILLPFVGINALSVLFILSISTISTIKGVKYLLKINEYTLSYIFLITCFLLLVYCVSSAIWSSKKIKSIDPTRRWNQ